MCRMDYPLNDHTGPTCAAEPQTGRESVYGCHTAYLAGLNREARMRREMEEMKKAGQSNLKGLNEALEHHPGKKTGAREHTFSAADVERA